MDDFSLPMLLQHQQIFVAGISADVDDAGRVEQLGSSQKVAEFIGVFWSDKIAERGPTHNVDELVDSGGRRNQNETSALHSVCKLPPPALDKRADQDRGVEDRSDNGVSLRTSRTSASIWSSSIGPTAVTLAAIRSQISRHRRAHVIRSIPSAMRSCSAIGRAFTWSTIELIPGTAIQNGFSSL